MMGRDPVESGSERRVEIKVHPIPQLGNNVVQPEPVSHSAPAPAPAIRLHSSVVLYNPLVLSVGLKRKLPWLVPSIMIANVAVFVVSMYVNNCPRFSSTCFATFLGRFSFQPLKENLLLGPSSFTLEKLGGLVVDEVVDGHQYWRLFSCIWLHSGIAHLLGNMLSLLLIGIRFEQEFGFIRIGLLYVISGFGGNVFSSLFSKSGVGVGASGAIFGLLGGMLSELIINWSMYTNKLAALLILIFTIVADLGFVFLPLVDNFAHIGGCLSGFLLGFVFFIRPQIGWVSRRRTRPPATSAISIRTKHKPYQYVLWVISLLLLILGFTLGMIALLRGYNLNDYCSWCHYLTCISITRKWRCPELQFKCKWSLAGNQLNMTCLTNGRSNIYLVSDINLSHTKLCKNICS